LATLAEKNPDIVVLKVDIDEPGSPVARQYKVETIPLFEIYDGDGRLLAQGAEAVKWLDEAMRRANLTSD
jgi:hypothetical protein